MPGNSQVEPIVTIVDRNDDTADIRYWLGRTPEERIEAVLRLRAQYMRSIGYTGNPEVEPVVTIISPDRHA